MRNLLVLIAFLSVLIGNNVFAVPNLSTNMQYPSVDEEVDELVDPNNTEIQPNGSDIKPDKVYSQAEYEQIYRDLEVPTFSFIHGVDPDQYYDMKDKAWSPYPLMRLNSPIYFKSITIEPGYYLLTPRQYKGDWFILFKEAGKVKYTIPVFEKNYTSPDY